jgi:hypothetical protein
MQTNIAYSLKGQNTRLLAKLRNRRRGKTAYELNLVIRYELSKIVCGMIWNVHLLKTSIFVTKTPWTTLNCLSRGYIGRNRSNHVPSQDAKGRMLRAVKAIQADLLRASKQFIDYR